jgi:hypothetical protein
MEPLDDRELKAVLDEWKAPAAPSHLRESLFPREPWWTRVWRAQLRIPVPVAVAVTLLLLAFAAAALRRNPPPAVVTEVTFRELQPVKELKPRVIRRHYE